MPAPVPLIGVAPTSSPLDTNNANRLAILLEFSWGLGPSYARYARHDKAVVYDGNTFVPVPILDVVYGDQHGGSEDVPILVTIDRTKTPADKMIGQRFTPTRLKVWECDLTNIEDSIRLVWSGQIDQAESCPGGKNSVVALTVSGAKADTNSDLGLTVDSTCSYNFGDYLCKFNKAAHESVTSISAIVGQVVTIPSAAGVTDAAFLRWHRGYISVDGYSIGIRSWSGTSFQLMRPPPADWVGQAATLTPGCNGTLEACQYWGNTLNFGGIGRRMQNRNPIWETGEQ